MGANSLGVKAEKTDRHLTYRTGSASGAARNPSSEHFVRVIILAIYQISRTSGKQKKSFVNILVGNLLPNHWE